MSESPIAVLRSLFTVAVFAAAGSLLAEGMESRVPPTTLIAIDDVNVVPMTGPEVLHAQTVVVRDGRIVAMGPSATAIPPDAARVNGSGRFLMPGLVDAHVHLQERDDENRAFLRLFVANGVTTVMNLFGTPTHLRLRADVARGVMLGPRIFTSGPSVGTEHGRPPVTSPDDLVQAVRSQKRAGYDFIKLHGDLTASA
jgi:imidazolonepropionase-like amidohydrolase